MKTPEGANETNFRQMIRKWVRLEYACSSEVLKQKIDTNNGVPKNSTNWWQRYLPENQSSRQRFPQQQMTVCLVVCLQTQNKEVRIIPRVWGQVCYIRLSEFVRKIIPTRVGTSFLVLGSALNFGDHPHAYGDKRKQRCRKRYAAGSSPRIWGQAVMYSDKSILLRIIPTHMGTSAI